MPSSLGRLKPKYWRVPSAASAHGRRPNRVFGVIVIAPRRSNSAHLHQPWRATSNTISPSNDADFAPLRSVRDVALQVKLHSQSRGPGIDCCKVMLDICKVLIYIICVIRSFTNKVLERFFATGGGRRLSVQNTRRIANILRALDDASRPEDMNLPGFRFHALVGRDRGRYAVNASGNWRITFGWLDGDAIDVDLEDYH